MMNQAVVEALYSATYVEDYIDACENLPDDIQKQLSRMRELDVTCQNYMRDAEAQMESLLELLDGGDAEAVQAEINTVSWRLQQVLINAQEIGDDKLQIVQQIQDLVDNKVRQLDLDKKNLDLGTDSSNQDASQETKQIERPVRSTIIKRTRRARHEIFVPSILGPSTLAATHFTSDEHKSSDTKVETYRPCGSSSSYSMNPTSSKSSYATVKGEPCASFSTLKPQFSAGPSTAATTPQIIVKASHSTTNVSFPPSQNTVMPSTSGAVKQESKKHEKKHMEVVVEKKKYKKRKTKQSETPPPSIPIDPDEPTYCLCDQISYGEMIGCDNDLCPIEWFHFSCVSLTTKPKGKWYCPKCRGDRPNVMKPKAIFLKELGKYNREKEEKV